MLIRRITNRKAPRKFISLLLFDWYSSRMTGFCIIRRIWCFIISINTICLFSTKRFSIFIFIYNVFNWITINRAILILFLVLIRLWSLSIKEINNNKFLTLSGPCYCYSPPYLLALRAESWFATYSPSVSFTCSLIAALSSFGWLALWWWC